MMKLLFRPFVEFSYGKVIFTALVAPDQLKVRKLMISHFVHVDELTDGWVVLTAIDMPDDITRVLSVAGVEPVIWIQLRVYDEPPTEREYAANIRGGYLGVRVGSTSKSSSDVFVAAWAPRLVDTYDAFRWFASDELDDYCKSVTPVSGVLTIL